MKAFFFFLLVTFARVTAAQNEPYRGGSADGFSRAEMVTPLNAPTQFTPFVGGQGSGFASVALVTPLGYPNHFTPYTGGNGDGFSGQSINNEVFAYPHQFYAYLGGANDGWTGQLLPNAAVLPLTLFQFRGEEKNGRHLLHWITESESNTSHFVVERSSKSLGFLALGKRAARGNWSGRTTYTFTDSLPLQGRNQYRIQMWDNDGTFRYSPIIMLEKKTLVNALVIYPNPVTSALRVKLTLPLDGEIQWRVSDAQGRNVLTQKTAGNFPLYQINIWHLPPGTYLLQAITQKGTETVQFVKQ